MTARAQVVLFALAMISLASFGGALIACYATIRPIENIDK